MEPQLYDLLYTATLEQLNLPTLAYRRLRGDRIQLYKIMHGFSDMNKTKLFKMKDDSVNLRGHGLKIQKQHVHLDVRRNSFIHRVVKHWNTLPRSAVEASTVNIFKSEVDVFLSTKYNLYAFTWLISYTLVSFAVEELQFVGLTARSWQKWKRVFLTCPCHKIYREEAVGLKRSNYTLEITIFVNVKFRAILSKIDIL